MRKIYLVVVFMTLLFSWGVQAQSREGDVQVGSGIGMTFNPPVRFDFDLSGNYFYSDELSIGFDFDVLIRHGAVYGLVPFVRYHFDLPKARRIDPYVGGGMGLQIASSGSTAFDLMAPNLGFDYELTPHLYIGPDVSIHLLVGRSTDWDLHAIGRIGYRF